jgi:hypothetical protein
MTLHRRAQTRRKEQKKKKKREEMNSVSFHRPSGTVASFSFFLLLFSFSFLTFRNDERKENLVSHITLNYANEYLTVAIVFSTNSRFYSNNVFK